MAEKKIICGGFLVGDGLDIDGKTLYATGTETSFKFEVYDVDFENGTFNFSSTYDELLEHINKGENVYGIYHEQSSKYLWYDYYLRLTHIDNSTLFFRYETMGFGEKKAYEFEIFNYDDQWCGKYYTHRVNCTYKNNKYTLLYSPDELADKFYEMPYLYDTTHSEYYPLVYINDDTKTYIWQGTVVNDDGSYTIRTFKGVGNNKEVTYTEKTIA